MRALPFLCVAYFAYNIFALNICTHSDMHYLAYFHVYANMFPPFYKSSINIYFLHYANKLNLVIGDDISISIPWISP